MHWSYHGKNVTQEISQFQQTCQQQETRYNQHLQALTKNQPTTSGPSKLTTSSSLWRLALPVTISAHLEVFGDKSEELVLGVRLVRPFPTLPSPWCSERGNIHFRRSSVRNYWTLPQLDMLITVLPFWVLSLPGQIQLPFILTRVFMDTQSSWKRWMIPCSWDSKFPLPKELWLINVLINNKFEILHQLGLSVSGWAAWKAELTWLGNTRFRLQQLNL